MVNSGKAEKISAARPEGMNLFGELERVSS
jgi:hypothetical protein